MGVLVASSKGLEVVADQLVALFRSARAVLRVRATVCSSIERVTFMDTVKVRKDAVSRALRWRPAFMDGSKCPPGTALGCSSSVRSVAPLVPKRLFQVQDRSNWEWGRSEMAQRNLYSPDRRL